MLAATRPSAAEATGDTGHDVGEMRLDNRVVDGATLAGRVEKPAALHEPEMFARHVARNATGLGKLTDRVATAQEHLDDSETVGMGKGLEALSRLGEGVEVNER